MKIDELNRILDHITREVYDEGHGLLSPEPSWVIPAESLLELLREIQGLNREQMRRLFDEARVRVHGTSVDVD